MAARRHQANFGNDTARGHLGMECIAIIGGVGQPGLSGGKCRGHDSSRASPHKRPVRGALGGPPWTIGVVGSFTPTTRALASPLSLPGLKKNRTASESDVQATADDQGLA